MSSEEWHLTESAEDVRQNEEGPGPLPKPGLKLTGIFVAVVAIGLLAGWVFRSDDDVEIATVGAKAPGFTVAVIDGGSFDLAGHFEADGRPVVLNLWASWCIPCREEIPEISAFSRENPGIKVIGVAVEDIEENATEFAREIRSGYDMALGDAAFEDAYPRLGLPVTYIIDRNGVVTDIHNGILDRESLESLVSG